MRIKQSILCNLLYVSVMFIIVAKGIKLRASKTVSNGTAKPTSDNFVSICVFSGSLSDTFRVCPCQSRWSSKELLLRFVVIKLSVSRHWCKFRPITAMSLLSVLICQVLCLGQQPKVGHLLEVQHLTLPSPVGSQSGQGSTRLSPYGEALSW